MREINDQYPEYAEPYEPVKGGKHHKGIYGTRGPDRRNSPRRFLFFALIGLLLLLLVSSRPGGELAGTEPKASDKETAVTSETKQEEPAEPDTPEPPINPEEHKDIPQKPEEPQEPETEPEPQDSPDSPEPEEEPEDEPENDPEDEPEDEPENKPEDDPDLPEEPEEPTYKDPAVSIAHVYYWYCLGHIEVEYKITANDGEDITSSAAITSVADPSMTVSMPSKTGSGTIDANADGTGKLTYMSADEWKTDVTLAYTLNGENKTLTVSNTAQPEFMDFLWLDPQHLSGNSSTTNKVVSDTIEFRYGKNDRHTYDVSFTKIEMGWMKEVPLSGGGNTYEEVGSTRRTVWDGTGTCPITGPSGPVADGDNYVLTFEYHDILDVVPPADAADATHFYLNYYMEGTGTDTDGTVYTIHTPTYGQSTPCEIEKDLEVEINYIYLWDELNHIEVGYTITPGDAEDIRSVATVTSDIDPAKTVTMDERTGSGLISVNADGSDRLWWHHSGDSWTVEVELNYKMHGENRTRTVSVSMPPEFKGPLWLYGLGASGSGTDAANQTVTSDIVFQYPSDDRHTYDVSITGIDIGWEKQVSAGSGAYTYEKIGSKRTIWDGTGTSPVTGPTGPVIDGDWASLTFRYEGTLDATPPADAEGATHYYLICYMEGTGTDTDGTVYRINRPTSADLTPIALPGVTLVEPELSFDHLYWYQLVDHLELGYEITANDATDITSQAKITYDPGGSFHLEHTMPEVTGAGTKTVEDNAGGDLAIFSGGQWVTTITLQYKLGGESKEKVLTVPGNPKLFSGYMETKFGSISGTFSNMNVGYELHVYYRDGDRHKYTPKFKKVDIEWFRNDYESVGTSTIWEEGDQQVFWGPYPSGPNADGNMDLEYSFWYEGLDATPPLSSATQFQLHFYGEMNGNDEFDTATELYAFTDKGDLPGVVPPSGNAPDVTINHVYWWRELDHLMVQYSIEANDAVNIVSYAQLTNGYDVCSMESVSGDGSIEVSLLADDYRAMLDSGSVDVTIYLTYSLGGESGNAEYSETRSVEEMICKLKNGSFSEGESSGIATLNYDLYVEQNGNDPHDYDLDFREIRVYWYYGESDEWPADEKVIWDGTGTDPFTGSGSAYTYSDSIDVRPPNADCKYFALWFYAVANGNDSYDNEYGIDLYHVTEKFKLSNND